MIAKPIGGHGTGLGGNIVGYAPFGSIKIDSYAISLLVEVFILGILAFVARVLGCAGLLIHNYLKNPDERYTYCGALAALAYQCRILSIGAFVTREPRYVFVLVGMAMVLIAEAKRQPVAASIGSVRPFPASRQEVGAPSQ